MTLESPQRLGAAGRPASTAGCSAISAAISAPGAVS
jgi:hypothetical protein